MVVESSQLTWLDWRINIFHLDLSSLKLAGLKLAGLKLVGLKLVSLEYNQFLVQGTLEPFEALYLDRGHDLGM